MIGIEMGRIKCIAMVQFAKEKKGGRMKIEALYIIGQVSTIL